MTPQYPWNGLEKHTLEIVQYSVSYLKTASLNLKKLFYIWKHWTKACGDTTPEVFVLLLHVKLESSHELLSSPQEGVRSVMLHSDEISL